MTKLPLGQKEATEIQDPVPSPSVWIKHLLKTNGIAQRKLAALLGKDPSQVSRWVNGTGELVPNTLMLQIPVVLGRQDLVSYAGTLKYCEDLQGDIRKTAEKLENSLRLAPETLAPKLLKYVNSLATRIPSSSAEQLANRLQEYLTVASLMTLSAQRLAEEPEKGIVLISPALAHIHLRHPANAIMGWLINLDSSLSTSEAQGSYLDSFLERTFHSLRRQAKDLKKLNYQEAKVAQHATHLLARYGLDEDRELIAPHLKSSDLELQRMAYFGEALSDDDRGKGERLLWMLQRNPDLLEVSLSFDAVHYNDTDLGPSCNLPDILTFPEKTYTQLEWASTNAPSDETKEIARLKMEKIKNLFPHHNLNNRKTEVDDARD